MAVGFVVPSWLPGAFVCCLMEIPQRRPLSAFTAVAMFTCGVWKRPVAGLVEVAAAVVAASSIGLQSHFAAATLDLRNGNGCPHERRPCCGRQLRKRSRRQTGGGCLCANAPSFFASFSHPCGLRTWDIHVPNCLLQRWECSEHRASRIRFCLGLICRNLGSFPRGSQAHFESFSQLPRSGEFSHSATVVSTCARVVSLGALALAAAPI